MQPALVKLQNRQSLTAAEMTGAMEAIVTGGAADDEIERFLTGLREKGETVTEITAAARVMRAHAVRLTKEFPDLVDTCGTGGDAKHTLNVSTLASIVIAAAGARVAKHGNRSVSSYCGSADLLEMLGIPIELEVSGIERMIEEKNFGFFFAPRFHPAMRYAMSVRKRIQGKTIFNILGPLANPAGAARQLIGVYEAGLVEKVARALAELGSEKALVVHGEDGIDEISIGAPTTAAELSGGSVKLFRFSPADFGIAPNEIRHLRCDSKEHALEAARRVLGGEEGPHSDIVALNAAAGLFVAGRTDSIKEGFEVCRGTLRSGKAARKAEELAAK
ncbi:MAG: anthranilate phosphoribosyltransferase [Omnitrophica bacterium RIFCSPHIGHO2_02_FULL_63_14]|nr:MAG: anthranilate phosphoribosyltransferase [Omnitrophica bacterium RIFCSPHIGHO2_02_FULL_63_14]